MPRSSKICENRINTFILFNCIAIPCMIICLLYYSTTPNAFADITQCNYEPCEFSWETYVHECTDKYHVPKELNLWCNIGSVRPAESKVDCKSVVSVGIDPNNKQQSTNMSRAIDGSIAAIMFEIGCFLFLTFMEYANNRQEEGNPIK
jgi:hypothetical protein